MDTNYYGFLVKDARMFRNPIPYSGKLGFFEVEDSILMIWKPYSDRITFLKIIIIKNLF